VYGEGKCTVYRETILCMPNAQFTPAPYFLSRPLHIISVRGYSELHYAPRTWVSVPPRDSLYGVDAGLVDPLMHYAMVDANKTCRYVASSKAEVSEAESQAVQTTIWATECLPRRVVATDSAATMEARKAAYVSDKTRKAPMALQVAYWNFVRPSKGVTHLIKVESHLAADINNAADRALHEVAPTSDTSAMLAIPGTVLPLAPAPKEGFLFPKAAAALWQLKRDSEHVLFMSSFIGTPLLSARALCPRMLSLQQAKRLFALRSNSTPVMSTLLQHARHKYTAEEWQDQLALCPLCQSGTENTEHLFRCPALPDPIASLRANLEAVESIPKDALALVQEVPQQYALAAGLCTPEMSKAVPKAMSSVLRALQKCALDSFMSLWTVRCKALNDLVQGHPDSPQVQWIVFIRRLDQDEPME
jgi:hypothetical protein